VKLESLSPSMCRGLFSLFNFGRVLPVSGYWPVAAKNMTTELNENVGRYFIEWLVDKCPDMARRAERLPALIATLGLDRVIAEANRKPVKFLISSFGRTVNAGKCRMFFDHDGEIREKVEKDKTISQEFLECVDTLVGTPGPQHDILVSAVVHDDVAPESGDNSAQLSKRDVLPFGNEFMDRSLHFLENSVYS
jgi:hypothetical protein